MKRKLMIIFTAVLAAGALCSCTGADGFIHELESGLESAASSLESAVKTESSSSSENSEPEPVSENVGDYVAIEKAGTEFGDVYFPVFKDEKLDKEDAALANAAFEAVKDEVLGSIAAFLEENPDETAETYGGEIFDLSEVYCSKSGNILSVFMKYRYFFGYPVDYYKSVNFDLTSKKAMTFDETIKKRDIPKAMFMTR